MDDNLHVIMLDSVCRLSMNYHSFAFQAVDFFIDMLNDEIDFIRLRAIESMTRVAYATRFVLKEDQVESILSNLEDAQVTMRNAVRQLIR